MPELDWDYGYVMFWCIAGMQIICAAGASGADVVGQVCHVQNGQSGLLDLMERKEQRGLRAGKMGERRRYASTALKEMYIKELMGYCT
eukprot:767026-Hanusia_phi.AAC.3